MRSATTVDLWMRLKGWQFVSGNGILYYRILHVLLGSESSNLCNAISKTKSSTYCYQVYYYTKPITICTYDPQSLSNKVV